MVLTSVALIALAAAGVRYLLSRGKPLAFPWTTVTIAAVTTAVSVAGNLNAGLLDALDRNGDLLLDGQWWRIASPLLVQDGGWLGTIVNLVALLIAGTLAEALYSGWVLIVVYLLSGLVSEVAAYTLLPGQGYAGNSVAIAGVTALGLITLAVRANGIVRTISIAGLVAGAALLVTGDLHGVGFAVGLLCGVVLVLAKVRGRPDSPSAPGASSRRRSPRGR